MNHWVKMQELPTSDRPYERISRLGTKSLSDSELLAVIIQSGTKGRSALDLARYLLSEHAFGSLNELASADPQKLEQHLGIGPVKSARILSAIELGRRSILDPGRQLAPCDSPSKCADLLIPQIGYQDREIFVILLLNRRNNLIRIKKIAEGGLDRTIIEPRLVFKEALNDNAYAIILAHNHPSGDPNPSQADVVSTKAFIRAGEMIGMPIQDHIIVGKSRWVSLRQTTDLFSSHPSH